MCIWFSDAFATKVEKIDASFINSYAEEIKEDDLSVIGSNLRFFHVNNLEWMELLSTGISLMPHILYNRTISGFENLKVIIFRKSFPIFGPLFLKYMPALEAINMSHIRVGSTNILKKEMFSNNKNL